MTAIQDTVAVVAMSGGVMRGRQLRANLSHLTYARRTWEWWCRSRHKSFRIVTDEDATTCPPGAAPTIRRWFAAGEILLRQGPGARMALVDADTMIRWDTPDFFGFYAGQLAAVRGRSRPWVKASIGAYQHLFPDVILPEEDYFNAGVVVLGYEQVPLLQAFCRFCLAHLPTLQTIATQGDFGTDQTPLNFIVHREKAGLKLLPRSFNLLHCFGFSSELRMEYESASDPDWSLFATKAFQRADAFAFIESGFIWHFTNTLACRNLVMAETWRRIAGQYTG